MAYTDVSLLGCTRELPLKFAEEVLQVPPAAPNTALPLLPKVLESLLPHFLLNFVAKKNTDAGRARTLDSQRSPCIRLKSFLHAFRCPWRDTCVRNIFRLRPNLKLFLLRVYWSLWDFIDGGMTRLEVMGADIYKT